MRSVYLCLFVLSFGTSHLLAQSDGRPSVAWQKVIGGVGTDAPAAVRPAPDGGYFIGGSSDSGVSPLKSSGTYGGGDFWLVRLDSSGAVVWDHTYGGDSWERLHEIEVAPGGGVFLGGVTMSGATGSKSGAAQGEDGWLVRVDHEGYEVWQRSFGGADYDSIDSLAPHPSGGLVLGCSSTSRIGGNKTEAGHGKSDVWLVAVNASGETLWQKSYGGANDESGVRIRAVAAGGYIVGATAATSSDANKTVSGQAQYDYWILRLDADGNKLWEATLGGTGFDVLSDIKPTSDGGFIVAGRSDSSPSGNKSAAAFGSDDMWVVKLNDAGQVVWDRTFGGAKMDFCKDVVETPDGGLLLGGASTSFQRSAQATDSWDYWLIRLNSTGHQLWQTSYGGPGNESNPSITLCGDGTFFMCGACDSDASPDLLGAGANNVVTRQNFWALKLE